MEKSYSPQGIESKLYKWWEESGYFKPSGSGESFSVVIPPPNVTGALHMGHALNQTIQDIVVRFKRLNGFNVLWVPGTDHAGIATQNVVEKALKKDGKTRHDFSRDEFINKVWDWKHEYGSRITTQIRAMGASVDWSRERFTMDDGCQEAVLEHFVSLYKKGLIYRGKRIINWCPRCHTALSDIEVEFADKAGKLWHIAYVAKDGTRLVVATTRPETLFGDTAVAVHPDDERYAHLVGTLVQVPFTDREIPVVADEHVDKDFGSGAVKVTPAHDPNDFEIGERHDLEKLLIMDESGVMNDAVPAAYQGLDRYACRKQLVADLESAGLLVDIKDHDHNVGGCYRCSTTIEPYLSNQWFVKMDELVKPALDAVRNSDITFTPARWEKIYFEWMENIRDWCISRQIVWGHRIPVWYKDDEIYCGVSAPDGEGWTQDLDVLDTWFSSSLWPFSTLGWPQKSDDLKTFYPTSLLVTGYDIITFWVSRMITMGLEEMQETPFSNVYIHGLVRDSQGRKMSKSLGNVVDPLELISKYGADALRFALASLSTLGGQDITYTEEKVEASRNFANKMWNVTRYILMNLEDSEPIAIDSFPKPETVMDEWILSSFQSTLATINKEMERFNFAAVCDALWDFVWNQFCDWYIEASKLTKAQSMPMVIAILQSILKVMHPIMPFLTEELWQTLRSHPKLSFADEKESLSVMVWPVYDASFETSSLKQSVDTMIELVRDIRRVRQSMDIPESKKAEVVLQSTDDTMRQLLETHAYWIKGAANLASLTVQDSPLEGNVASSVVVGLEWFMSLDGLIDIAKEKERLEKQLAKFDDEIAFHTKKLSNEKFVSKAPEHVVNGIREKAAQVESEKELLLQQIARLG